MGIEKPSTGRDDKCTSDKDCKANQKCCPTISGKMCMSTKDGPDEPKPNDIRHTKDGECPADTESRSKNRFSYRSRSCTVDKDCPGHRLCCRTDIGPICMLPRTENPRSKVCDDGSEPFGTCNSGCRYGYECQSGICCRILKLGKCPAFKVKMLRTIPYQLSQLGQPCDCDCDCIKNYKCCIKDGESTCVQPEHEDRYKYYPKSHWIRQHL